MRYGQLQQGSNLLGNTTADYKVLEGTYVAPEVSSESVVGMLQMILELAFGVNYMMVDILITFHEYTQYWKGCREKT